MASESVKPTVGPAASRPPTDEPGYSVVVPVRDEAENVGPLIDEIRAAMAPFAPYEMVFVDDGSRDTTAAELKKRLTASPELQVVRHRVPAGQSAAIITGVRRARGAVVVTLDGDGQNDPKDIPALIARFREAPDPDRLLVVGLRGRRMDSLVKRMSSRVANRVRSGLLGDRTPDTGCGLKVFSRRAFLDMPSFDHMHRFLPALMLRQGGEVISVPVNHRPRRKGRTKYGLFDRLGIGIIDLFGVLWLMRRVRLPEIETDASGGGSDGRGSRP